MRFNNILNRDILFNLIRNMKYLTDHFQLYFFCIGNTKQQWRSPNHNLRDRDSRLEIRDRDFIKNSETETLDFKICGFCRNLKKMSLYLPKLNFFRISPIFPTCFHCFLPAIKIEKKTRLITVLLSHILAIFKVSRQ